ncbi:MAG: flippase-like domain-containing protein [Deltaproteobacteria bacterium]|nr:flippase-like domain-containing protein [Deltaproteobacteria bacterium]
MISHKSRKRLVNIFRWLLLFAFIFLFLQYFHANQSYFTKAISNLSIKPLVWMFVLSIVSNFITALKYHFTLRAQNVKPTLYASFKFYVIGRFLGMFMPQSGTIYRGIQFKKYFKVSYVQYAASFAAITWLTYFWSVIFLLWILIWEGQPIYFFNINPFYLLIACFLCFILVPLLGNAILSRITFSNSMFSNYLAKVSSIFRSIFSLISKGKLIIGFSMLTILSLTVVLLFYHIAFTTINISLKLHTLLFLVVLLQFSTIFNLTPGNTGILEFIAGFATLSSGFTMADGILVMVEVRLVTLISVTFLSLLMGARDLIALFRSSP